MSATGTSPSAPTAEAPTAPTAPTAQVPVPTLPPNTDGNTVSVTPYSLLYTIEQTRIPTLDDYSELGMFTSEYLNVYFQVIFAEDPAAEFVSSTTEVIGSDFRLGQPTRVDFTTTVSFAATSTSPSSVAELDMLIRSAFEGQNAATYATAVAAGLDDTNIFATTSLVTFESVPVGTTERRVGIVSGAAALVFVLVLGGVMYRSRGEEEEIEAKPLDCVGHVTVADDTYRDDASFETYEPTEHSDDDDESTIYSRRSRGRPSKWANSALGDLPSPRHRLNTVPPDFEDDSDSESTVVETSRKDKREDTPAEIRKRLENMSW